MEKDVKKVVVSYKDLIVWKKSMQLVLEVYKLTKKYPDIERYVLISQTRRCSISIPSNIAEGSRRGTRKNYRNFLLNAFGSGAELETQILIAKKLGYVSLVEFKEADKLLNEVMRMLNRIINKLEIDLP